MMDDQERALLAGIEKGKSTGIAKDEFGDIMHFPDFDGSISEYNRGREIGAAIKNSEDKNR